MILDLRRQYVVWSEEAIAHLKSLAASGDGHLRRKLTPSDIGPLSGPLSVMASMLGNVKGAPILTVNDAPSDWHRDSHGTNRRCVIAWAVRDVTHGGDLEWVVDDAVVERYAPGDGDVALIDGSRHLHRIAPFTLGEGGYRISVVLAGVQA